MIIAEENIKVFYKRYSVRSLPQNLHCKKQLTKSKGMLTFYNKTKLELLEFFLIFFLNFFFVLQI